MSTANNDLRYVWVNIYAMNGDSLIASDISWSLDEAKQRSTERAQDGRHLIARRKITEGDFDE